MPGVMQEWVSELSLMQQTVLMTAVRGPDGLAKWSAAKLILRFLRRSFLISAMQGHALMTPYEPGGGSFTGPAYSLGLPTLTDAVREYFSSVDEMPLHFHLHLTHAAEILGYKHPYSFTRAFWRFFYLSSVSAMHLYPETEEQLDARLGDSYEGWKARDEMPTFQEPDYWFGWVGRPRPDSIPPGPKIHILYTGFALCGFTESAPANWPVSDMWVVKDEAEKATCPECRSEAVSRLWLYGGTTR